MAKPRLKQLEFLYLIALGCIAISILISQALIQSAIARQQDDARVINVAGRQRMLSQKIAKEALKISQSADADTAFRESLRHSVGLWEQSHEGLLHGDSTLGLSGRNSAKIVDMFAEITPYFRAIRESAHRLPEENADRDIKKHLRIILENEPLFLEGMDRIVFQYDNEAHEKVTTLQRTELTLLVISIFIIVLELIFVFRPLAISIRNTFNELEKSENSSKKMTLQLSKLYEELGKSYQDLEAVSVAPESPSVYAKINRSNWLFTYLSPQFYHVMEYEETAPPRSFKNLLLDNGYKPDFVLNMMEILRSGKNWSGEIRLTTEPGDFCWLETFLAPVTLSKTAQMEVQMVAQDITRFKEAKARSRELNKERIERSVKAQQYRSSFILEGQEEERKRLSRELHDGLGQMLSAMKLLLESMTASSKPMQIRLEDARSLMKSIIREVRRVSFNLTPSSLDDFGLIAAVYKFCEEINRVTKLQVEFINETSFINRLEGRVETNLYRIIQEAVNNAIKYAKASNITVKFSHNINTLYIEVTDNGKGFNLSEVTQSGHFEKSGHGIFNMRERTAYIGAVFNIDTTPGEGTKISITLSLDKND